jgi:alcohol dehydrogenase (cytochrome c)
MRLLKRFLKIAAIAFVALVLVLTIAVHSSHTFAWRYTVLKAKATGKIPEVPLLFLLKWMRPDSYVNIRRLAVVPNVNSGITNSNTGPVSAANGARVFGRTCAECHGDNARGRTGPDLLAAMGRMSDWGFFSTVKWGRRKTIMMAQPLSDLEVWQVLTFLRQSAIDATVGERAFDPSSSAFQPVSADMLRSAGQTGDWLTYAGNYAGYRHSLQAQITNRNVQHLRLAWAAQLPADSPTLESSPIVVGDRMFVTESPEGVTALNAKTGAVLWEFHRPVPGNIPLCCGSQNRGVAVLGKNLYVATLDAHLLALDAATGAKLWDVQVADWHQGYSMTAAPLIIDDRVVVGIAGGDFGIRGFVTAFSASDGAQLWKTYTIPAPGEPGNETWANNSWQHAGVATWNTGSYDPALGLIYWGTGNPDPVFNTATRAGTNLYACSLLALDARTGALRWYYQFTPADDHDWDATQQPILADIKWQGETVPAVFEANRNAFFYALDRRNGNFLFAKPFAKQTWASGFTPDGRPIVIPSAHPSRAGTVISPAAGGATNWWPPSFDPQRKLLFVPSVDAADLFFSDEVPSFHQGTAFTASGFQRPANQPMTLAVRAIDISSGDIRWDTTLAAGGAEVRGEMGGVLSTEGGLVFAGFGYEFFAFDIDTGKKLWITPLGGILHSPPISYSLSGQQFVSVIGGRTLFTFTLPDDQRTATRASTSTSSTAKP